MGVCDYRKQGIHKRRFQDLRRGMYCIVAEHGFFDAYTQNTCKARGGKDRDEPKSSRIPNIKLKRLLLAGGCFPRPPPRWHPACTHPLHDWRYHTIRIGTLLALLAALSVADVPNQHAYGSGTSTCKPMRQARPLSEPRRVNTIHGCNYCASVENNASTSGCSHRRSALAA